MENYEDYTAREHLAKAHAQMRIFQSPGVSREENAEALTLTVIHLLFADVKTRLNGGRTNAEAITDGMGII